MKKQIEEITTEYVCVITVSGRVFAVYSDMDKSASAVDRILNDNKAADVIQWRCKVR